MLGRQGYGSGSSRDSAAKGTALLGVRAVLVESFERIHRSNLIGMGVLPLQYRPGESAESLGLTGHEVFDVIGIDAINSGAGAPGGDRAGRRPGVPRRGADRTPGEAEYYRHGGIMQYVLRSLLARGSASPGTGLAGSSGACRQDRPSLLISAANSSNARLWSASDSAFSGSGWTSMSRPWAPAARAAQAIGAT